MAGFAATKAAAEEESAAGRKSHLQREQKLDRRDEPEFLGIAARAMRRVLVDHARARGAAKRGGGAEEVTWIEPESPGVDPIEVMAIDEALDRLAALSKRQAEVVELRYFGGLTLAEAASSMGIGRETAKDHWEMARAWLNRELSKGSAD